MSLMRRISVFSALLILGTSAIAQKTAAMKAIVAHEYGGPEVLKYEDAPRGKLVLKIAEEPPR